MESTSIWKKMILLALTSIFALHVQIASAQDNTDSIKTNSDETECVIMEDDQ